MAYPAMKNLRALLEDGAVWFGDHSELLFHPTTARRSCMSQVIAPFGIREIDSAVLDGGLKGGALHEWFYETEIDSKARGRWHPPLQILACILANALAAEQQSSSRKLILWIGERCWPTPSLLQHTIARQSQSTPQSALSDWQSSCIFVALRDNSEKRKVEILSHVLHSPALFAMIADGSGLSLGATRRLQLAAREGGALACIARPPWEALKQSTAQTRWRVQPVPSPSPFPCWSLELFRARGLVAPKSWSLEWHEGETTDDATETNSLRLSPASERGAAQERDIRAIRVASGS
jgi:protein ImuA